MTPRSILAVASVVCKVVVRTVGDAGADTTVLILVLLPVQLPVAIAAVSPPAATCLLVMGRSPAIKLGCYKKYKDG